MATVTFDDGLTHILTSVTGAAEDIVVEGTGTLLSIDAAAIGAGIGLIRSITVGPGAVLDISSLQQIGAFVGTITLAAGAVLTETLGEIAALGINLIPAVGSILRVVACFTAGSMIETETGLVAVEKLRIGDQVRTEAGALRPVKWIGRRSYPKALVAENPSLAPVLVRRDAITDGVPSSDLRLSAQHGILLEGVLVPVAALVNGRSVLRAAEPEDVAYWHVELDSHDVLLANNLPAETFVDCDNRSMFHNAGEFHRLYPDDASPSWAFCVPRIEDGAQSRRLWRQVAGRAGLLDPAARPVVDGHLDLADRARVSGWAWAPALGDVPLELEVVDGEAVIARVRADLHRPGLREAGIGDGHHAFDLRLPRPLDPFRAHRIHVRTIDGTELKNSPIHLAAADGRDPLTDPAFAESVAAAAERAAGEAEIDAMLAVLARETERLRAGRAARVAARAPLPGTRAGKRGRALVIDDVAPDPSRDAGSCALLGHVRALLALGFEVEFAAAQPSGPQSRESHAPLEALGARCHHAPAAASVEETLRLHAGRFDLVYLHRFANAAAYAALARRHNPMARLVYSVADLHHLRIGRQGSVERRPDLIESAGVIRRHELLAMRQCDAVITHSTMEAEYLAREAPDVPVHVVPWPVAPAPTALPFAARRGIAFLGSERHPPNRDAVRFLAEAVLPRLWEKDASIVCLVAGHGWTALPELDPRIESLGHVTDLATLFDRVRATVAPLRFGAGVKGKVLDSLARGVPCVMSTIAAEGIGWPDKAPALIGEDAARIAALLHRMHTDAAANAAASAAGLALIRANHAEEAVRRALERAITPPRPARPPSVAPTVRMAREPALAG